jgi:hypothetical protein
MVTGNQQFAVGHIICRERNVGAYGKLDIYRRLVENSRQIYCLRQIICLPCVIEKPTANQLFAVCS